MSSAVAALLEGEVMADSHGKRSRYRAWCACCAPAPQEAGSKKRSSPRPKLAWRQRLEAQQALSTTAHTSMQGRD